MAWNTIDTNTLPATGSVALWSAIARLIAQGATLMGSGDGNGDGTSAWANTGSGVPGHDGPGPVTHGGAGGGGLGNGLAWARLQWPADGAGAAREVVIQRQNQDTHWTAFYSYADGFITGGGTNARPTAADEKELFSNEKLFDTNGTYVFSIVAGQAAEDYTWIMAWWQKVTGTMDGVWFMDRASLFTAGDLDPVVFMMNSRLSGYTVLKYTQLASPNWWETPRTWVGKRLGNVGAWGACMYEAYSDLASLKVPGNASANHITGLDDVFPMLNIANGGGYKQTSRILRWKGLNRPDLSTLSVSAPGAKDYLVVGDCAIPWNGADPVT